MDVICERCKAEYEFDDSLLGDRGTTVKCSTCGHVFRVMPTPREASRAPLKVRFLHGGRVENIASLRDLQRRIHAGEVTVEDQLGRDGFPWRRLGDVPELRNFFASKQTPPAAQTLRSEPAGSLRVSHTSMPPEKPAAPPGAVHPKRTVLGLGPSATEIPRPPRVPQIAGPRGGATTNGLGDKLDPPRVPTSDAPTSPGLSGRAPTPTGPAPTSNAPTAMRASLPASASQTAPPPPSPALPAPVRSTAPAAPNGAQQRSVPPKPTPVRLRLSEDEGAPARATESSSKTWLYALVAVVLAGAGWLGMNAFAKKQGVEPVPSTQPALPARVEAPVPAANPATPSTATPATPAEAPAKGAQAQPPTAPPNADAPPVAPANDKPAATPASRDVSDRAASSRKQGGGSGDSRSGAEPKDYGGWVSRGDQAFSRGDYATAQKAYEEALALRATGSEANTGLGFTLLAEGRAREAVSHFDRAASNGYADASIGLGDAYRKLGERASAEEAYSSYLDRLPSGSRASYAKAQLENLGRRSNAEPAANPEPAANTEPAEPSEAPVEPGPEGYRPAGELEAPPPAAPSDESSESTP